ncbi:MAG TPA: hypothetical protein VLM38_16110, partial [Blastocatellia bacterium]|nr:hypothetical protein [Blastocatellia bacterium]
MKAFTLRVSLAASLLVLFSLIGVLPAWSDSGKSHVREQHDERARTGRTQRDIKPLSYRSPGATHKLMLAAQDGDLEQRLLGAGAVRRLKRYGAYSIAEVSDTELQSVDAVTLQRAQLRDDLNLVMLKRGQLDTTGPEPGIAADLRQPETSGRTLHLVQLFGPPTADALRLLTGTGARVVGYIPNNTYLMWTTRAQRQRLRALQQSADGSSVVQWDGPYHPAYKLDRSIKLDSVEQI